MFNHGVSCWRYFCFLDQDLARKWLLAHLNLVARSLRMCIRTLEKDFHDQPDGNWIEVLGLAIVVALDCTPGLRDQVIMRAVERLTRMADSAAPPQ